MPDIGTIGLWILAAFLMVGGAVNVIGPQAMRRDYQRWGYPSWFGVVTGVLLIVAGGLLLSPPLRLYGAALGLCVAGAAFLTLVRCREFNHTLPSAALFLVLLWVGYLQF